MASDHVDAPELSLLSLEDELSCSICLSPFSCPVTIPCGHNFCQDCLLSSWKDSYSCPQCRAVFPARPELKKNTVLSAVVETFLTRSGLGGGQTEFKPQKGAEAEAEAAAAVAVAVAVIRCDTCMEAEASHTCLTCMASFCDEHLRPHRDNPVFRLHQLGRPVADLTERICPDHHKLMELFCSQHQRSICSLCLQKEHRGCSLTSQEEQRSLKETNLREKLTFLDGKISKTEAVLVQMKEMQSKLQDSATNRKRILSSDYQQMREQLAREERDALGVVDRELDTGVTKLRSLSKKFQENIDGMNGAKDGILGLLAQSQTLDFLQTSYPVPLAAGFDPYAPRLNLDSRRVLLSQNFALALKEHLTELLRQPLENRLPIGKPEPQWQSKPPKASRSQSPASRGPSGQKKKPPKPSRAERWRGCDEIYVEMESDGEEKSRRRRDNDKDKDEDKPEKVDDVVCFSSGEKRSELLKYGTVLTFDPRTAHKRIALSEGLTRATVSDQHADYPDDPRRFTVCSQVLAAKGFSRGRHYWEVRLSGNNFVGVGLAYGSMDRKGPASRLGRNAQSWCVEWFNVKLSAWHNGGEAVLANPGPRRVGVLLDCGEGVATFYNVTDRAYPFHAFVLPVAEAVHPAFWIFSSGSSLVLSKLQG